MVHAKFGAKDRTGAKAMTNAQREGWGNSSLEGVDQLIWLLGDLMNAAENYYGAENPKRNGHINCAAANIIDKVITPMRNAVIEECARTVDADVVACEATLEAIQADKALSDGPRDRLREIWHERRKALKNAASSIRRLSTAEREP